MNTHKTQDHTIANNHNISHLLYTVQISYRTFQCVL